MLYEAVPFAPARAVFDPGAASFACAIVSAGRHRAWVRASGELDIASSPELERVLDEAQTTARVTVLDLYDLAFIDASGVHVIVEASRYARIAGHELVVLCRPPVRKVFGLTGMIDEVDVQCAS